MSDLGKLVIIAMMFIGRLGPLSFGLALFQSAESVHGEDTPLPIKKEEDVAI
ncbi:MAG: hypothetical protein AAGK78_15030 [Planctomycetota bacterium]